MNLMLQPCEPTLAVVKSARGNQKTPIFSPSFLSFFGGGCNSGLIPIVCKNVVVGPNVNTSNGINILYFIYAYISTLLVSSLFLSL